MSQREGKECVRVLDRGGRVLTLIHSKHHMILTVNGKDHYSNIKANIMVNHR